VEVEKVGGDPLESLVAKAKPFLAKLQSVEQDLEESECTAAVDGIEKIVAVSRIGLWRRRSAA